MFLDKIKSNKEAGKKTYKPSQVIPVYQAKALLSTKRHKIYMDHLLKFSKLSQEDFDIVYRPLVENFSEFVQLLPEQIATPILGSLLTRSLVRALNVIYLEDQATSSQSEPLVRYAIYSAVLLRDAYKAALYLKVLFTNKEGECEDVWNPYMGSMLQKTQFYRLLSIPPIGLRHRGSINALLARIILPSEGFAWISGLPPLFYEWLDLLADYKIEGTYLTHVIGIMDKLQQEKLLLEDLPLDELLLIEVPDIAYGQKFYDWLKDGLESGEIAVNTADAFVHVVEEGIFLQRDLFKQFADLVHVPVNMFTVFQQFGNLLGIAKKGGHDSLHMQYFSVHESEEGRLFEHGRGHNKGGALHEGMLVSEKHLIFKKDIPPVSHKMRRHSEKLPASLPKHESHKLSKPLNPEG